MVAAKNFDLIHGFAYDYMHGVLLGLVKGMFDRFLTDKNKAYYLRPRSKSILNSRIKSIQLCRFFSRRIRGIENRKFYKATEYRTLFLYVLPIALQGLLPNPYFEHFCLFSALIYELLRDKIEYENLENIRGKIVHFVCNYEKLYGTYNVTMNLHRLLHVVDSVLHSGPLWATSLFAFESNNRYLLSFINGNQDILTQIAFKYSLNLLNKAVNKNSDEENNIIYKNPIKIKLSESQLHLLQNTNIHNIINGNVLNAYASINWRNDKYTCSNYSRTKKTVDYYVKYDAFGDETIAKVLFYFKYKELNLMMVQRFDIVSKFNQFREIHPEELDIVEVNCIIEKLIYIKVQNKNYVVSRPNKFEKD